MIDSALEFQRARELMRQRLWTAVFASVIGALGQTTKDAMICADQALAAFDRRFAPAPPQDSGNR